MYVCVWLDGEEEEEMKKKAPWREARRGSGEDTGWGKSAAVEAGLAGGYEVNADAWKDLREVRKGDLGSIGGEVKEKCWVREPDLIKSMAGTL